MVDNETALNPLKDGIKRDQRFMNEWIGRIDIPLQQAAKPVKAPVNAKKRDIWGYIKGALLNAKNKMQRQQSKIKYQHLVTDLPWD